MRRGWWVRARAEQSKLSGAEGRGRPLSGAEGRGRPHKSKIICTQVDPEGWCASCKEDKPEEADRNNTAAARHIDLLVRLALPEELN